jgi:catechol 2,3-dioxygenase-like lactoylglutathione lyase family enzyme
MSEFAEQPDAGMKIESLDHLVLTVADIARTRAFYEAMLGMRHVETEGRHALHFGSQKINLHQKDNTRDPKALHPMPGSADLCFITALPIPSVLLHLARCDVPVIEGPVGRTGATGQLLSVYVRDLDDNLIEISNLAA